MHAAPSFLLHDDGTSFMLYSRLCLTLSVFCSLSNGSESFDARRFISGKSWSRLDFFMSRFASALPWSLSSIMCLELHPRLPSFKYTESAYLFNIKMPLHCTIEPC